MRMELEMDRVIIAYLLIAIIAVALVAVLVFAYQNTPKRRYKRLMKREHAARRQHQAKLHGE